MERRVFELENGVSIESYRYHTMIIGSGAAGLNCAERLFNSGVRDIAILTSDLHGGTSYRSGSDKQTYYKMSVFGQTADSPIDMAHSLFDGGCMHGDMAYIEGLYSLPAFYHLVENGVPFPFNSYGAFVGYKTDHDPRQRATSAGPKTSRFMVETSLAKVREKGIPIFDGLTVTKIITDGNTACGVVAIDRSGIDSENLGIKVFATDNIVLATGGPGELYASSVYPAGQVSLHGAALDAGAQAVNLGESQFGIASIDFRWNLSGTYQQVVPSYFSISDDGVRHNFLADYYPTLSAMASNIFLKGYQWPFSANRASDYGSSLVDIAIAMEKAKGRRVFLDFMRNPVREGEEFDIQTLSPEARDYLVKSEALQETPYERLAHMNPDSIDIYSENGIDLREPLEIDVCFQHNNGGLWVDNLYRTNIENLFAIGEVAGVHGVARPGGSALNSGQVGGIRVAQYIASRKDSQPSVPDSILAEAARDVLRTSRGMLGGTGRDQADVRREIQRRMTEAAGFVRDLSLLERAVSDSSETGVVPSAAGRDELVNAWETRNLWVTHAAFLKSILAYAADGGGSRGSYLVKADPEAEDVGVVDCHKEPVMSFRKERQEDRRKRIIVHGPEMSVSVEEVRSLPEDDSWFETTWAEWKSGKVLG